MSVLTDLSVLDQYRKGGFPEDFETSQRTFFSPVDDLHGVLLTCLQAAKISVAVAMYGFDDEDLANALKEKLEDESVAVQLTLDSSQAGGVHEKQLLSREDYPNSIVAVGRSEKGAIMHQKLMVVDGKLSVTGSTNWSTGGESKQDNQLTVHLSRPMATICRARIDAIHAHMLGTDNTVAWAGKASS